MCTPNCTISLGLTCLQEGHLGSHGEIIPNFPAVFYQQDIYSALYCHAFPRCYEEEEARLRNWPYLLYETTIGKWAQRIRSPPQDTAHFMRKQDEGTVEIMLTKLLPEKFFSVPYLNLF